MAKHNPYDLNFDKINRELKERSHFYTPPCPTPEELRGPLTMVVFAKPRRPAPYIDNRRGTFGQRLSVWVGTLATIGFCILIAWVIYTFQEKHDEDKQIMDNRNPDRNLLSYSNVDKRTHSISFLALAVVQWIDIIGDTMTRHISLQEAIDIMDKTENPLDAANDPRLLQFINDVDAAGVGALEKHNDEYLASAVGLMMSSCIVKACESPSGDVDLMKMIKLSGLMGSDDFQTIMIAAFKFVVGISVIEELR